jgi:DNA-binding NtrC family response regulator
VEEDSSDLQLYTSALEEQGHIVDGCTSYQEGAQRLEAAPYDLIILSQRGRAFEGHPLLERAIELDRHRPVLVMTRAVDMRSYLDVMHRGAHDYLEKPPSPLEIAHTVRSCLARRRVSSPAAGVPVPGRSGTL